MVSESDIYIYAHIHKPYVRYIKGKCIINIGSVGMPFDGLNKPSYTILDIEKDSFQTSIVRVSYDVNKVFKQFRESDYPNMELITNILYNAKI
jgi:predicted phosphodiesterase